MLLLNSWRSAPKDRVRKFSDEISPVEKVLWQDPGASVAAVAGDDAEHQLAVTATESADRLRRRKYVTQLGFVQPCGHVACTCSVEECTTALS